MLEPAGDGDYVRVDGLCAALDVCGSGPPLLLIHGLGCSGRYFRQLQRLLAADFTIYTPDLPGHGRSQKPDDRMWQLHELTDWVTKLITALGLHQPLVVGHSLGGGIAVDLAARYPTLIHGTVLLAPTGVPEMPPLLGQLPLLLLDGVIEPLRLFPWILPAYLRAGPRRILRLAVDQTRYGQRLALRQITEPMLVLHGSRDPLVSRASVDDLGRECPNAEVLELPGGTHALHVSHPDAVCNAIRAYAAQLSLRQ